MGQLWLVLGAVFFCVQMTKCPRLVTLWLRLLITRCTIRFKSVAFVRRSRSEGHIDGLRSESCLVHWARFMILCGARFEGKYLLFSSCLSLNWSDCIIAGGNCMENVFGLH